MRFNLSGRKSNGHNGMLGIWDFMVDQICFYVFTPICGEI